MVPTHDKPEGLFATMLHARFMLLWMVSTMAVLSVAAMVAEATLMTGTRTTVS